MVARLTVAWRDVRRVIAVTGVVIAIGHWWRVVTAERDERR